MLVETYNQNATALSGKSFPRTKRWMNGGGSFSKFPHFVSLILGSGRLEFQTMFPVLYTKDFECAKGSWSRNARSHPSSNSKADFSENAKVAVTISALTEVCNKNRSSGTESADDAGIIMWP